MLQNERQAFTQSPWEEGELLEKIIAEDRLSPRDRQSVSKQLVELAVDLSKRRCVHGEVTPPNVFCRKDNVIYLMNPDFSKPMVRPVGLCDLQPLLTHIILLL